MYKENYYEEWKEIRARADSMSNAIFLIAGGALSLSITVMLGNKGTLKISTEIIQSTVLAWYLLLFSIALFLLVKACLIVQAMLLQLKTALIDRNIGKINSTLLMLGLLAFISFIAGMYKMVQAAVLIIVS
ncbi:hypothetical protein [Rheinheimera aquimaris]|uniref:hypothetical protein n=1 Tax=Rheinheimera aquimaris TaxID=412437 RepID=UPI00106614C2|nr:hypothetical protein [Rheinheimera aquimaris]